MYSESKYFVFIITVIIFVPLGVICAVANEHIRKFIFYFAVFFSCYMRVHINFVSMEWYRGTARGFEITLVDLLTFVLLISLLLKPNRRFIFFPPGWWLYFIYTLFSAFSVFNAKFPVIALFELWKMVRMYFFFLTMYNFLLAPVNVESMIKVLRFITVFVFIVGIYQKYFTRKYQIESTFPHQNSMAMYMSVLGCFFLSAIYNRKYSTLQRVVDFFMFAFCGLMIVFSLSRGGLVTFIFGASAVIVFSIFFGLNSRKLLITTLLAVGALAVGIKVSHHLYNRFMYAPEASKSDRIFLAGEAKKMADSRLFGIGLNHFGEKINESYLEPYNGLNERRIASRTEKIYRHQLVETTYMMIAAECGWPTLGAFIILLLYFYFMNMRLVFKLKNSPWQYICIGWLGSMTAIYVQTVLEWVLKQTPNYYQLMLMFASTAAIVRLNKLNAEEAKRASSAAKKRGDKLDEPPDERIPLIPAENKEYGGKQINHACGQGA